MRALAHSVAAATALLALPFVAAALALRPQWRIAARERLGGAPVDAPSQPGVGITHAARGRDGFGAPLATTCAPAKLPGAGAVWVHGASVGEVQAGFPLLDELRARGRDVVVSSSTLSGRALVRRVRSDLVSGLAPLDHPWAVERALARVCPEALVLLEAELWPCWIAAAKRRGIPVALLSGRISDRSFARYRRILPLIRPTLERLDLIGARTQADAERFEALGARAAAIVVSGDLKFDAPESTAPPAPELVRLLGDAPVIVAGSTHAGEESQLLAAMREVEASGSKALLVLAPRDLARADEVAAIAAAAGRRVFRRSAPPRAALQPGEVLVLDTLGELRSLYAHARVAFVGGSLVPVGGHNLLEPVASGRPVVFGPHMESAPHLAELLERSGVGRRVADADELALALLEMLRDRARADFLGRLGRAEIEAFSGSSLRCADLLEGLLVETGRRGRP